MENLKGNLCNLEFELSRSEHRYKMYTEVYGTSQEIREHQMEIKGLTAKCNVLRHALKETDNME